MKQTASIISTYTADVSGVCSALFELGGMTVMHDASGCNSTYNTHDEPRWYDFDSMVYISALSHMEAIMGDDDKLFDDISLAASQLNPKFIALCGTPVPMMTGFDFKAAARILENRCGVPCFGLSTNGMNSYISGASMAFEQIAMRLCKSSDNRVPNGVNIIGATPLDFSVNGYVDSLRKLLVHNEFEICSVWAMGDSLDNIVDNTAKATVNLVVSQCGLAAARVLQHRVGTPFVLGAPIAGGFDKTVCEALSKAVDSGVSGCAFDKRRANLNGTVIIGEAVTSLSLAQNIDAAVICPLESDTMLAPLVYAACDEDEIVPLLKSATKIIADPLYRPICPNCEFVELPHEAFSGRIYRDTIPNLLEQTL